MKHKILIKHHVIFWIVYTFAFSLSEGGFGTTLPKILTFEFLAFPFKLFIVYFNWLYLVPQFFNYKSNSKYLSAVLLTILGLTFLFRLYSIEVLFPLVFPEFMDLEKGYFDVFRLVQIFLVLATLTAITTFWQLYLDWMQKQKRATKLEMEKKETELKYLKSQINPHFLFNTLNTIYSMSLEESKKVPRLILRLSDFLSFSLYETNQRFIPIQKEVELIDNFIELQKDRFQGKVEVNFNFNNINKSLSLPPMVFISLVENAFKHSMKDELGIAKIDINLSTEDSQILLEVKNSRSVDYGQIDKNKSGIGLNNIRRRLDLIYDGNYILDINDKENEFVVILKLNTD